MDKHKRVGSKGGMERSFGFTEVDEEHKQAKVDQVFDSVASKYDLMNDVMSLGMHRLWKEAFVTRLNPKRSPNWKLLDVAGGTGDVAFKVFNRSAQQANITVLDINRSMLEIGKQRAQKFQQPSSLTFIEGNAESLPFPDHSFDAYTIAFGIRNVPHIDKALQEAWRVLKYGGRFMCLEFSEVDLPLFSTFYDLWSFYSIPFLGKQITGDAESYRYLVESIRKFPNQKDFATMIEKAGFRQVKFYNLTGGIAAIHSGWKI